MAKWIVNVYATYALLEAAIEALDNTTVLHVFPYMENGKQKFGLAQSV